MLDLAQSREGHTECVGRCHHEHVDIASLAVGILSLLVAAGSLAFAWIAKRDSRAATAAVDKIQKDVGKVSDTADRAHELAVKAEDRRSERHEVNWELRWHPGWQVDLINKGPDVAHKVRISYSVDGRPGDAEVETVGGPVPLDVGDLPEQMERTGRQRQEEERRRKALPFPVAQPFIPERRYDLVVNATWETDLGTPREEGPMFFGFCLDPPPWEE